MVVDRSACRQRWAESRSVRCNFSITAAARRPSKVTSFRLLRLRRFASSRF